MLLAPRTLLLLLRESDRRLEAMFGLIGSLFGSGNQHVGLEAKQFGLVPPFTSGCGRLKPESNRAKAPSRSPPPALASPTMPIRIGR
jgi:hypothetical protein